MISRGQAGQLAYNAEERCRMLSMIVLDALGKIGNGSDSQILGRNLLFYNICPNKFTPIGAPFLRSLAV